MIFSSTLFIFIFLPVTLICYYASQIFLKNKKIVAGNIILLITSLFFYAWGEPVNVLIMAMSVVVNYYFGIVIDKESVQKRKKILLFASVVFNLGLLLFFKYYNFFEENVRIIFNMSGAGKTVSRIALPIGISFFTFQIMSYVIDVYRKAVAPQKSIINLGLYISFFPQLIAGPIVRYIDINEQIQEREITVSKFAEGVQRFIIGFSKKILIANNVAVFADMAFNRGSTGNLTSMMAWVGAVCYALQIYFDFSGYSDMAIGIGKMFGFTILENFDYPYISASVQEFWRRWHISLSSWFRDYLYIPLGGNRKGKGRTYINLIIVFAVTGFWHGASWSFLLWGLFHGLFLIIERAGFSKILKKIPKIFGWLYSMVVVLVGWVLFRADNLSEAVNYIGSMFNFSTGGYNVTVANINIVLLSAIVIGCIVSAPVLPYLSKMFFKGKSHFEISGGSPLTQIASFTSIIGCGIMLFLSITFLCGSDFNPFLYFRF